MSGDEILASNIQIRNIFLLGVVRTGHVSVYFHLYIQVEGDAALGRVIAPTGLWKLQ